jgi:hypothetical protein
MSEGSERSTEVERVEAMRLSRALAVGLPFVLAERFAITPHADLHRLETLVAKGCRPITAARILL